jgi:hypothetical protein
LTSIDGSHAGKSSRGVGRAGALSATGVMVRSFDHGFHG